MTPRRIDNPMSEAVGDGPCSPNGFGLCQTHPTCDHIRHGLESAQAELTARHEQINILRMQIADHQRQLNADRINALEPSEGVWRVHLRDFASDSEQHEIDREQWATDHWADGVTLYSRDGFFAAYFDDANILWNEADDDHPLHHVMIESDPPHRTVIHPLHLAAWVQLLASRCIPVQIMEYVE